MNHKAIQEQLGAYALGMLDSRETERISHHLDRCSSCWAEAKAHLAVSARLGGVIPSVDPPPALRARILASVAQMRQQPAQAAPAGRFGMGFYVGRPAFAVAAGVVTIALLGTTIGLVTMSQVRINDLQSQNDAIATENEQLASEIAALKTQGQDQNTILVDQQKLAYLQALPKVNRVVLKGTTDAPSARGLILANPDSTWGYVLLLEMEPLKPGMGYQVWLEQDGRQVSAGMISSIGQDGYGNIYVKAFPQSLMKFTKAFVTTEPLPGSLTPKGKQLLAAPIAIS